MEETTPTRRCTASQPDSAEEEEAEDEAVLLVLFDLLLAVCNVGGERRRPLSERSHGALGLGFCSRGEMEEQVVEGSDFMPQGGGPGSEEEATAARAPRRQAAAVIPLSPQRRKLTGRAPCQCFNIFPVFRNSSRLWTFNGGP